MSEEIIIGIIGIFASVGFFFLGIIYGKKISKDQIKLIVDALNMDRLLDNRDKNQEKIIFEDNEIAGETKESFTFKIKASFVDIQNKRKITTDGTRELTDDELIKMGKHPRYWKAPTHQAE